MPGTNVVNRYPNPEGDSKKARGKPASDRTPARSKARSEVFRDLLRIADAQGIYVRTGVSTSDALQKCLDRAVALWEFAATQTDSFAMASDTSDEDGGGFFEIQLLPGGASEWIPNKWYRVEREARQDIENLAGMMMRLGIAERHVRIQEAQAALFVSQVREAAIEAGISPDSVRLLGEALRRRVAGATVDPHGVASGSGSISDSATKSQAPEISRYAGALSVDAREGQA